MYRIVITLAWIFIVAGLQPRALVCAQAAVVTKVYRGSVGESHFEMRLRIAGKDLSGTYSYDRTRQDIKISGRFDDQGRLDLTEFDARGKTPTGKFLCKHKLDDVDPECTWSRSDGSGQKYFSLTEQHVAFTNGLQIVPKVLADRRSGVRVSYPQIIGGSGQLLTAANAFNKRIASLVNQSLKAFTNELEPNADTHGLSFGTNYDVSLGTNDLVSVEMDEYTDSGGAHPNTRHWALTYDLAANRELQLADLFKPEADYKTAIADYVVLDINRRATEIEKQEAEREGRKFTPRSEQLVTTDQLAEIAGWSITPKGVVVYFDFPHVIAVFDRTLVPYSVIGSFLKPDGTAARFAGIGPGDH